MSIISINTLTDSISSFIALYSTVHSEVENRLMCYFYPKRKQVITPQNSIKNLQEALMQAKTYTEFTKIQGVIDKLEAFDAWSQDPRSEMYDFPHLQRKLAILRDCKAKYKIFAIQDIIKQGLLRNIAGIHNSKLFMRSPTGSKVLIKEYLIEFVGVLIQLAATPSCSQFVNPGAEFTREVKLKFFHECKIVYGTSCLLLEGGNTFGLFHLGVVKALHEHQVLPRVIVGSSIGALIASLVCIHSESELPDIFLPGRIGLILIILDLKAFAKKKSKGALARKIKRFFKHGYLLGFIPF